MGADLILQLLRVAGQAFIAARVAARVAILQAALTTSMLATLYGAIYIVQAGDLTRGLHNAFAPGNVARKENPAELQDELRQIAVSDRIIRQLLQTTLDKAPTAARARLAVIHNGVTGLSGVAMLRFDVTHMVAAPGRDPGNLVQNQPLSNWTEYLNTMIAGNCALVDATKMQSAGARARLEGMGVTTFLSCPVIDPAGQMLGGVFLSWDGRDEPPVGAELKQLMDATRDAGRQLALALSMRAAVQ